MSDQPSNLWICDRCGFIQFRQTLYVLSGTIGPDNSPADPCPNDGQPMRRMTWEELFVDAVKCGAGQVRRAVRAEEQRDALLAVCKAAAKHEQVMLMKTENQIASPPLNWFTLSPRERDALIAEKVMGWEQAPHKTFWINDPIGNLMAHNSWSPTTDPKACAEVIEKMRRKGFASTTAGSVTGRWVCELWKQVDPSVVESGMEVFSAVTNSETECRCLAALRACGVEVGP